MKSGKANRLSFILLILGGALIVGAAALLIYTQLSANISARNTQELLKRAEAQIPAIVDRIPEERGNNVMPSMELDGVNIIGIIEVPLYSAKLPIHASWNGNMVSWIPCRFSGSVYDRSLIIGAGEGDDQFDFAQSIQLSDVIYVTDMMGGRYTYSVSDIERSAHANKEQLESDSCDLTIFVKNSLSMEYIIIRCKANG